MKWQRSVHERVHFCRKNSLGIIISIDQKTKVQHVKNYLDRYRKSMVRERNGINLFVSKNILDNLESIQAHCSIRKKSGYFWNSISRFA